MMRASIIHDLLTWLDNHLDNPLTLDHVAAKSGYSKWHLQRMFKEITGQAIGSYIRKRRLSRAAMALRLTSRPILEIALQYHFDSQQTFTRAFKKQFNQTPSHYRRSENWDTYGICPPIILGEPLVLPEPDIIILPEQQLIGITQEYTCTLEQLPTSLEKLRKEFWRAYLDKTTKIPDTLYGLHHVICNSANDDQQQVFYTTAIHPNDMVNNAQNKPIKLIGGKYIKFTFNDKIENLQNTIINIYSTILPTMRLIRRQGNDIEIFYPGKWDVNYPPQYVTCDYLIPITD